jgi:peptidoglycan/xylan/chitin deacetylase (PgdA/CDA1 family)
MHSTATAAAYLAKAQRRLSFERTRLFLKRPLTVKPEAPIVSFTFDDFPRSAFLEAAGILDRYRISGTYYVSMGFMGKRGPLGPMFQLEDLKELRRRGHELGCHTFDHCHSWNTQPAMYEKSIFENQQALNEVLPGAAFRTFAYPVSMPRLATKRVASRHFQCCRGGGRCPINSGTIDLNLLSTSFLEKNRQNPRAIKDLIQQNAQLHGWLIFATHDVSDRPSPFGCTPNFFEEVVQWAVESGARVLPVLASLEVLQSSTPS